MRRALAVVVACLLSGCSAASVGPMSVPDWPLTGLPAADSGVDVTGPATVVKVDNVDAAMPQRGLAGADIVVEEPVEGGVTRLAVFYHSDVPNEVGPVRSLRSSDIGVVGPADAVLVASGGAPEPLAEVDEADIVTVLDGQSDAFYRDDSRPAPHNLFVDLQQVVADLDEPGPPGPFFTFGPADDLPAGEPATGLDVTFSPASTTVLDAENQTWARRLEPADGFRADTVVVLLVQQQTAGYLDPSGAPVPVTVTEGTGTGWLAHDGEVIEIEWSKESSGAPWTFSTPEGAVAVPPGHTYLALVPESTGSVQVRSSG